MKATTFPEQTLVIAENQPEYESLPAHVVPGDHFGRVVFCWKLTWRERIKLLLTGKLWHHVLTFHQLLQPQRLEVTKPDFALLFIDCAAEQYGMSREELMKVLRETQPTKFNYDPTRDVPPAP